MGDEADEAVAELEQQQGRAFTGARKAIFRARGERHFIIPEGNRWDDVLAVSADIGAKLNAAMRAVNPIQELPMLQKQLIEEIKQIPSDKLAEVYDLVHYFRLGLAHEKQARELPTQRPIGLAKTIFQVPASFFEPLPDEILDAFEGNP